jgi:hypothetical protein
MSAKDSCEQEPAQVLATIFRGLTPNSLGITEIPDARLVTLLCQQGCPDQATACRWITDLLRDKLLTQRPALGLLREPGDFNPCGPPILPMMLRDTPALWAKQPETKRDMKGVASRNLWFLQQYEAIGTETYHKPAKIYAKWDGMKVGERAIICPDSPNKITKAAVDSAIKRTRKSRDEKQPAKSKRKLQKKA